MTDILYMAILFFVMIGGSIVLGGGAVYLIKKDVE